MIRNKIYLLFLFLIGQLYIAQAQKFAVTDEGKKVILYDDGTWKYENDSLAPLSNIPLNKLSFNKSKKSDFLLKSTKSGFGFYLNTQKWSFKKATNNEDAEYELTLKDGDLYAMIITEKIEIPLESLRKVALENGKAAAPDIQVVKEEFRMVNGLKMLFMQMNGTIEGMKFSYYGYYYSSASGTVQFITYTSQNLINDYHPVCDELLNGLVEIK